MLLWAAVQVSLARDENGRPAFGVRMTEDMSKRRQLEEQLRQAQSQKLRGRGQPRWRCRARRQRPHGDRGLHRDLPRELGGDDPRRRRLTEIQKASERASALTRQLLAFSGKQVLRPQLVDLNDVVAGIEPMLRRPSTRTSRFAPRVAPPR